MTGGGGGARRSDANSRREAGIRTGTGAAIRVNATLIAIALAIVAVVAGPIAAPPGNAVRAEDQDPFFAVVSLLAALNGQQVTVSEGGLVTVTDPPGDMTGAPDPAADVTGAGLAYVPMVPSWLVAAFGCGMPDTACPADGSDDAAFNDGAYLLYERFASPPADAFVAGERREMGLVMALDKYPAAPSAPGNPFSNASHAVITRAEGDMREVLYFANSGGSFQEFRTSARTMWRGNDMLAIVPKASEVQTQINAWDVYSYWSRGTADTTGRDNLRGFNGEPMLPVTTMPEIEFATATASPTPPPTATPPPVASQAPQQTATPQPSDTGSTSSSSTSGSIPWAILIVIGIALAVLGAVLLRGRGGADGGETPSDGPGGASAAGSSGGSPGGSPAGGPAIAVGGGVGDNPCPPLIASAKAAQAECDAATAAAATAADVARTRAAEADAARRDLEAARRAREAAEKELARRQKPPDRGGDSASTSFGGRTVTEDSYDLHLLEDARAAANDAWEAAKAAATTDAERKAADDAWQEELQRLDGPDGIDEIRRRDKEGRAKWVKEAEDALEAAHEAEAAANAAYDRAVEASAAATAAATAAARHADEACARAEAAKQAAIDAGCLTADGRVPPAVTPPPPVPPTPPEPPAPPPTPPTTPIPPEPPTPPTHERPHDCPDDAAPRITERNPLEVDLFIISESQLRIDSNYPYGDNVDDALDNLDDTLKGVSVVMSLPGAVTDPVGSLLGTAGLPGFDSVTTKPAEAAAKSLRKLRARMEQYRRTGTWSLSVPFQHYRFLCRITEECRGGEWVVTKREFVGERVGKPAWHHSPPYEVQNVAYDSEHAWRAMTASYVRRNAQAERQIGEAATACAG